ncbi:hypothetical protein [Streptomyces sp. NPDC029041]|uniref:hypothetical protein n=1 Tax=Streptomyces sp. NPDC029041 TaxID=3155727 RepID=UPI00341146E3
MAPSLTDDQDAPAPLRRERPSRLIDVTVALLLLIADAVIVVVGGVLLFMVGMGRSEPPSSPPAERSSGTPVLAWLVIWGVPAVAAAGAVVHARLRMPVTAAVQSLFTLVCVLLAVAWTRMLLS